jgi:hypothetical protein
MIADRYAERVHRYTTISINNDCTPEHFWRVTQQHALELGRGRTHATIWASPYDTSPPTFDLHADYRLTP